MRMSGLDKQGVWKKMNKGLVGGRTEMTGKVMESREENHGGRMGEADQAGIRSPDTKRQSMSLPGSVCLLGNLSNDQSV